VLRHVRYILIVSVCAAASPAYAQYPYPPYGWPYRYDNTGSARIQVTPKDAEVYVDGYYVGRVDDFDGSLQRLHVEAGEHELMIYREGYRTIREKVLFTRGNTLKVTYTMQPLQPGDAQEPRPKPDAHARTESEARRMGGYGRGQRNEFGTIELRVRPIDATVLVDGEEWTVPEGQDRLFIDVAEGPHRIEVRKEGFVTYVRTIEARRGRVVTVNVSLTAGG
jgi:hypothetical protein